MARTEADDLKSLQSILESLIMRRMRAIHQSNQRARDRYAKPFDEQKHSRKLNGEFTFKGTGSSGSSIPKSKPPVRRNNVEHLTALLDGDPVHDGPVKVGHLFIDPSGQKWVKSYLQSNTASKRKLWFYRLLKHIQPEFGKGKSAADWRNEFLAVRGETKFVLG